MTVAELARLKSRLATLSPYTKIALSSTPAWCASARKESDGFELSELIRRALHVGPSQIGYLNVTGRLRTRP